MFRKWTSILQPVDQGIIRHGSAWIERVERLSGWSKKLGERVIYKWSLLHLIMGFLLGRAFILQELSPFAVPYMAVMFFLRREKVFYIGLATVLGASTHSADLGWMTLISLLLTGMILLTLERRQKVELAYTPIVALASLFVSHSAYDYFAGMTTGYDLFMNGVEAVLAMILTLIFIQSLPVLTFQKHQTQLKSEEVVCLIILLASVMTGTVGWYIQGVSVEHILSRFLVLIFAAVGGGTIGAAVGVVTGLILSLADVNAIFQISVLAFSGLLAGLLKEGGKIGAVSGMFLGSAILSFYSGGRGEILQSVQETIVATVIFLLIPRAGLTYIARYIPGTPENIQSQQEYLRKIRDITAKKVENFSEVFQQLSRSFLDFTATTRMRPEQKTDLFLSEVTEKTCQKCWKKEQCWDRDFLNIYESMVHMAKLMENQGYIEKHQIPESFQKKCVKTDRVTSVMLQEMESFRQFLQVKKQIQDARRLVGEQLSGVSRVMRDFSREIQQDVEDLDIQQQQIHEALEDLGLSIRHVDVVSLDPGNVEIKVSLPSCFARDECMKIVAPLLSDVLKEHIMVKQEEWLEYADGYCVVTLISAQEYVIDTGVAGAAKGGKLLSGDSYRTMNLGNGKYVLAISDGMGNGERAYIESSATLELLQQLLKSGIDETLTLKTVNSVLSLRSTDEIFATVDLAMIDLNSAETQFIKFGSTPSFIKRGDEVISVNGGNLPIGILKEIDIEVTKERLKPGDLLIMMTDGIYDAPKHTHDKEQWMKRIISEFETDDPQALADCLLEKVIRYHHGEIHDDMTVLVARIDRHLPEWGAIHLPGFDRIERPGVVS